MEEIARERFSGQWIGVLQDANGKKILARKEKIADEWELVGPAVSGTKVPPAWYKEIGGVAQNFVYQNVISIGGVPIQYYHYQVSGITYEGPETRWYLVAEKVL